MPFLFSLFMHFLFSLFMPFLFSLFMPFSVQSFMNNSAIWIELPYLLTISRRILYPLILLFYLLHLCPMRLGFLCCSLKIRESLLFFFLKLQPLLLVRQNLLLNQMLFILPLRLLLQSLLLSLTFLNFSSVMFFFPSLIF